MKKLLILFIAAMIACPTASSQDWAKSLLDNSPRHLEWIKNKHDNLEVNCFMSEFRSEFRGAVRGQAAGLKWQSGACRLLLGRGPNVPPCHRERRIC
jgi:hypothetical protein